MQKSYLPPLKSLQYFLVAAQLSSFKLAAQELNVTQGAISQQIKLLEEYFGFLLFIRQTRSIVLSEQGRNLLPFVEQAFELLRGGIKHLSGDPNPTILRISAINSFTSIWLLPRISIFQELHPEVMIQIAPNNSMANFETDQIDLAIRMGEGKYKGLQSKLLVKDEMFLVASPTLISIEHVLNSKSVFSLPWIEDTSVNVNEVFRILCRQHKQMINNIVPVIRAESSITIIDNILQGRGFGLANRSLVLEHIESGKLLKLLNFSHPSPYSIYLVAPEQNFNWEKIKKFETWLTPLIERSFGCHRLGEN
jgi:LysR family glycine cleavage system transcriptional activator